MKIILIDKSIDKFLDYYGTVVIYDDYT